MTANGLHRTTGSNDEQSHAPQPATVLTCQWPINSRGRGDGQRYAIQKDVPLVPKKPTIEMLRNLGPSMLLFSLRPLLAGTKSRELHANYKTMAAALARFLQGNRLTTRTLLEPEAVASDDFTIRAGDLTDEGLLLYRDAEQSWLKSLGKSQRWDDTTLLKNVLATIRENA